MHLLFIDSLNLHSFSQIRLNTTESDCREYLDRRVSAVGSPKYASVHVRNRRLRTMYTQHGRTVKETSNS